MKTIFSPRLPPLPIVIDYNYRFSGASRTRTKELGRMLAALKRCDRVRGITFSALHPDFDTLTKGTNCLFPILEDLQLCDMDCGMDLELPVTFLKGSAPHLRRLKLYHISPTSISSLLSSATMLVELSLTIYTPYPMASLLAHLRGTPCLCRLELTVWGISKSADDLMPPTTPGDIFLLSKLTYFHYMGRGSFLSALVAGFAAPYLEDVQIRLHDDTRLPILVHLPRFIDDIEKLCHSAQAIFGSYYFGVYLLTQTDLDDYVTPPFRFFSGCYPESLTRMSATLSNKLSRMEELSVIFTADSDPPWLRETTAWHRFLQHFRSVKVLRVEHKNMAEIAGSLLPNDHPIHAFFPMLEEIDIRTGWGISPTEGSRVVELAAAAIQPFIAVHQEAGRHVKFSGSLRQLPAPRPNMLIG